MTRHFLNTSDFSRPEIEAVVPPNTWDSIAARMTEVLEGGASAVGEPA